MIHIHQGGTLRTYCGAPLDARTNVQWPNWDEASCPRCVEIFRNLR